MITEIKKGNKAGYNGFLLGKKEYEDYMFLKSRMDEVTELFGRGKQ